MPTIEGVEDFTNGMSGGGAPFLAVGGSPQSVSSPRHADDPASLQISSIGPANEYVQHSVATPDIGWMGFWFRMQTADEPVDDQVIALMIAGSGTNGRLAYAPASNAIYWYMPTSGFASLGITLDAWHWVEAILDCSTSTRRLRVNVDGTAGTEVTLASEPVTTVGSVMLGYDSSLDVTAYYSYWNRGEAVDTSDWSGELSAPPSSILFPHRAGW